MTLRSFGSGTLQQPLTLVPRNLGDILNETFAVYGKRLKRLLVMVAVVQVPVTVIAQLLPPGVPGYVVAGAMTVTGMILVYAAGVFAVGQHYVTGEIDIGRCYRRVSWRLMSLTLTALVIVLTVGIGAVLFFIVFPVVVAVAYAVYWSMTTQTIMVEGYKLSAALRRSFDLVRGAWWRVFGFRLVFVLVGMGLGFLVYVPFALLSWIVAPDDATSASLAIQTVGTVAAAVAVPPVIFIAGTLLYYDLRVRKEDYDIATLSQEMGVVAA